jgi:ABC-type multidrug transport system fused ATPase/permease subunit
MSIRLMLPLLLGRFVDDALDGKPIGSLTAVAGAYVVAALLAEMLQLGVIWFAVELSWRAGNRLRERLAAHALRLEMAWHGRHSPGQLIERIDGDVEALVVFFSEVLINVVGNAVLVVGMIAIAFTVDPRAGAVLLVSAVVGGAVMVQLRMAAVSAREAEREANAILYGDIEERLGGLEDLRANGAGHHALHRLHANSARTWRAARRASLRGDGAHALAAMCFAGGSVAILALGVVLYGRGALTIGAVVTLFRYSDMLRQPLERIAEQLKEFQKAMAGARRAAQLLATEPAIRLEPPSVLAALPATGGSALPPGPLQVELRQVTFAYDTGREPALIDIDLDLAPGRHLGIVGRTGSGKTTIGRLILRLWDVEPPGVVRIGGVDIRQVPIEELRGRVAVVTQDVELFRASLRDNLTIFGALPAEDSTLEEVLDHVGLERWRRSLPNGLETELAGGLSLSAGEAQLLAFARAFLSDPGVVVLDEASSRLDPATEVSIATATRLLLAGRTAVVIAHRLSTLDEVDEIAVVDDGRVVEHGSRATLAADPGSRFAALLRANETAALTDGDPR